MNDSIISIITQHLNSHLLSATVHDMGHGFRYREPVPHITCRDGTIISIQAGDAAYCTPRNNQGPWTHVEVMMINGGVPVHFEYPECDVAGYVPIEAVAKEILSRGNWVLT
jgi:hypothetical protein